MLTPKSLTFKNIGRFVTPQTIDFTQLGDLVQVDGQNNCSGGSSGAGKSTVLKALSWLLGLDGPSTSVLQSRLTKEHIEVSAVFDFDGQTLKIERGRKLLIDLDGEVTTGSSKLTEEKLDTILGMPRDLFSKILHKQQGSSGFFLEMGGSDTHKFLTACLKKEEEQKKILKLDEISKTLSTKETSLKSEVESNKIGLEASKNALNSLGEAPKSPFNVNHTEHLKSLHGSASNLYNEAKTAYETEKEELERSRPKISVSPFDRTSIERKEVEIQEISKNASELQSAELTRQSGIEAKIKEILKKISELEFAELSRQSEVKNKISSSQLEISNLQKIEQNRQSDVRSKIATNRLEHNKAHNLASQGDQAKEAAKKLAVDLNAIRASTCPTCQQGWITDSIKAKEVDILNKLGEYRLTVIAGAEAHKSILNLDDEHKSLLLESAFRALPEIDDLNAKIAQLKLDCFPQVIPEVSEHNAKIGQLKLESTPRVIPEVLELKMKSDFKNQELQAFRQEERNHQLKENTRNQEILADFAKIQIALGQKHESNIKSLLDLERQTLAEYELALVKLKSFESEIERYSGSLSKFNAQITTYESKVTQKSVELASTQEEIETVEEAKKTIKSYLSCSFDDALESIGDKATRLIRMIPNMSNATIQFEGTKENKDGRIKEEVVCIVSMGGEIGIPLKSLSGGERSSADLATDLAVIQFIEERTGKGSNLYIMDEPFLFLDSVNIEQILEMIRDSDISKKFIIVDHNPIVKEMVPERIVVVREGEESNISYEKT